MEATLHTLRRLTAWGRWLCLSLLAIYACSGIRTVAPHQTALILRLGRLQSKVHPPGLLLALPSPLDEVILLDTGAEQTLPLNEWLPQGMRVEKATQIRQISAGELRAHQAKHGGNMPLPEEIKAPGNFLDPVTDGYTMTGDWNIVQGRFSLRYRIADPVAYFRARAVAEPLLRSTVYRVAASVLSRSKIDRALSDEREKIARVVVAETTTQAQALGLGIQPLAFEIRELAPPRQVIAAFEDVTNAKLFAGTLLENAEEYKAKISATTVGQSSALRQRAEAYSNDLVASAKGEAQAFAEFHDEYRKNPQLAGHRLYSETMGYIMHEVHATTLLPPGTVPPNFVIEPAPDNTR